MTRLTDQQVFDSAKDYMLGNHNWKDAKSRGGNGFFDCDGTPCALMKLIGAQACELRPKYHQDTQAPANNLYFHATGRTLFGGLESDIMRIYDQGKNADTEKQLISIAKTYGLNFDSIDEKLWTTEDQLIFDLSQLKIKETEDDLVI